MSLVHLHLVKKWVHSREWIAFGKVNMLKVLGSMLGLATLMGVLGAIVSTGVGALIMGVGAQVILALIGSLVVIGKGLGEFAESILPFEQMNVPRIKQNIRNLHLFLVRLQN